MKKIASIVLLGAALAAALPAQARNEKYMLPIAAVLKTTSAGTAQAFDVDARELSDPAGRQPSLDSSVALFFGEQAVPSGHESAGEGESVGKAHTHVTNDEAGCFLAFKIAMVKLQRQAKAAGANAVINVVTFSKDGGLTRSASQFECHAGRAAWVLAKGDMVKLSND